MNEVLPVGTVLKIKDNNIQLMIIGYDYKYEDRLYDYVSVIHPIGIEALLTKINKNIIFFNQEDIEEVYSLGYLDKNVMGKRSLVENLRIARKKQKGGG